MLGDDKPSTALNRLQSLAPSKNYEKLVRYRFIQMMPTQVKVVLASLDSVSLDRLAEVADNMMEQLTPEQKVQAVTQSTSPAQKSEFDELKQQVADLTKSLNQFMNDRSRSRSRDRDRDRDRSRSGSRPRYYQGGRYCFYHFRFRDRATKCQSPCQCDSDKNTHTPKE